jgi:hypothetical protein
MMTSGGVDAIDLTRRTEGNANYLRDPSAMADNNYFYWVTWEINTTAYVGLLVGSVPNLDAGAVPATPRTVRRAGMDEERLCSV